MSIEPSQLNEMLIRPELRAGASSFPPVKIACEIILPRTSLWGRKEGEIVSRTDVLKYSPGFAGNFNELARAKQWLEAGRGGVVRQPAILKRGEHEVPMYAARRIEGGEQVWGVTHLQFCAPYRKMENLTKKSIEKAKPSLSILIIAPLT
jgi:hypothetical protein